MLKKITALTLGALLIGSTPVQATQPGDLYPIVMTAFVIAGQQFTKDWPKDHSISNLWTSALPFAASIYFRDSDSFDNALPSRSTLRTPSSWLTKLNENKMGAVQNLATILSAAVLANKVVKWAKGDTVKGGNFSGGGCACGGH